MRFFACKRGITIIELMIGAALLGTVLGIGYMYYGYVNGTFNRGETRWEIQQEVRRASGYVIDELRYAYEVQLNPAVPDGDIGDYDNYIFFKDGFYIHKYKDENKNVRQKNIIDGSEYAISFSRVERDPDSGEAGYLDNVLAVAVESRSTGYRIDSKVMMLNMPNTSITGEAEEAGSLKFSTASPEEIEEEPPPPPSGCFIATAAYGSELSPAVVLLQEFRDRYLLNNAIGKSFVRFYYKVSPAAAARISSSEPLKLLVRVLLVPVVLAVYLVMRCGPAAPLLAVLLLPAAAAGAVKFKNRVARNKHSRGGQI